MKSKYKKILGACIVLVFVIGGIFLYQKMNEVQGAKTIKIVVVDNNQTTIVSEDVHTDATTLASLLKELNEKGELKVEYTNGTYGMMITALGKDNPVKADDAKKEAWTYTSPNNESCVKLTYCEGADSVNIADKDEFIFTLINY